ncbi:MAG: hypothetical protein O7G86_01010, partial [Gammaproteobacteria bacterium]|nr:hypothetical protein [Gammaproteobacteria bacterium]
MSWKHKTKRLIKIAATMIGLVAGLVVLLFILLLLQPVRTRILDFALEKADDYLPGTLTAVSAAWPSPGTIEIDGIAWVDGPDTLAAADRLAVSVSLGALLRRDVHVNFLELTGGLADIPAISRRFDSQQPDAPRSGAGEGGGFPREGALPGMLSISADRFDLHARYVNLGAAGFLENIRVRGAVDLLQGSTPLVKLDELTATETTYGASVDSLWLSANLATLSIEGRGVIRIDNAPDIYLDCRTTDDHAFAVSLTAAPGASPPEVAGLTAHGKATLDDNKLRRVQFEIDFKTPGTDELAGHEAIAPHLRRLN